MRCTHSNWGNHLSWRPLTLPIPIPWRNSINMYNTVLWYNLLFVPSAIICPCTVNIVWYTNPTTKHISASWCPISNDRVWKSETLKFGDGSATKDNTRQATVNTVVFQPWPLLFLANYNQLVTRNTDASATWRSTKRARFSCGLDWMRMGWCNGIDLSVFKGIISCCSAKMGTDIDTIHK